MDSSKAFLAAIAAVPLVVITMLMVIVGSDSGKSCAAMPDGVGGPTGASLAGLNESQLRLARDGVAIGKRRQESESTIVAELAAQATETGFRNLANSNVPESLGHPNDGVGHDHDSVGPHQMRFSIWGSVGIAKLMNPTYQIHWFYDQADKLGPTADKLGPAELAQAVERSAPAVYARNLTLARQVYALFANLDIGTMVASSDDGVAGCSPGSPGALEAAPAAAFGQAVIAAAQRWIGTPYVWGGGTPNGPSGDDGTGHPGFDCSGLVLHAVHRASGGRISLTHYTQSQQDDRRGRVVPPNDRQPGDIVYFTSNGSRDSHHVAIYLGRNNGVDQVLHAPQTGERIKISPLSAWANERMDFRRFGGATGNSGSD